MPPPGVCSVREAELGVNGKRKGIEESPGVGSVEDELCVVGSESEDGGNAEVDDCVGTCEVNAGSPDNELEVLDVKGPDKDDGPRREESLPVLVPGTFE